MSTVVHPNCPCCGDAQSGSGACRGWYCCPATGEVFYAADCAEVTARCGRRIRFCDMYDLPETIYLTVTAVSGGCSAGMVGTTIPLTYHPGTGGAGVPSGPGWYAPPGNIGFCSPHAGSGSYFHLFTFNCGPGGAGTIQLYLLGATQAVVVPGSPYDIGSPYPIMLGPPWTLEAVFYLPPVAPPVLGDCCPTSGEIYFRITETPP